MAEKIFTFRISEELLEKLRLRAEKNKRSIAKELEYIAEQAILHEEELKLRASRIVKILKDRKATKEEIEEYRDLFCSYDKEFNLAFLDALNEDN